MSAPCAVFLLLQGVAPQALVLAMVISYVFGFTGMLLAYLNYRRRRGRGGPPDKEIR